MISIGSLNKALGQLRNQLNTYDATAKFQDVSEGLEKAFHNPFNKLSQDHGSIVDGIKSLAQQTDNLADEYEAKLKPMITKLDESIKEKLPELSVAISDASDIDRMFSSSLVSGSSMFAQSKPFFETAPAVLKEIIQDGSLQSTMITMQEATGRSIENLTETLSTFKPEDYNGDPAKLVEDIDVEKIQKDLASATTKLDNALDKFTGGFGEGGGLMKNLSENLSNNIGSITNSLDIANVNITSIQSQVLSGDAAGARDILSSKIAVPSSLQNLASTFPGSTSQLDNLTTFSNSKQLSNFITNTKPKLTDPALKNDLDAVAASADGIFTKITDKLGSLGGAIGPEPTTPSNNNPVVNYTSTKAKPFQLMNSTEEIVKYLQASTRSISTLLVGWTGLTLDYSNHTAFTYSNSLASGFNINDPDGGFEGDLTYGYAHFFIRKDGTLETSRPIDFLPGYVKRGSNDWQTHGVSLQFNAGKNCYLKKYPGGKVPKAELTAQSITAEQWKTFNMFLDAWYTFFPAGDAFGLKDLDGREVSIVSPGFDVPSYVGKAPWNKANTAEPLILKRLLSPDEIAKKNKEEMLVKLREIRDIG